MGRTLVFESGLRDFDKNRLLNSNFQFGQRDIGVVSIGGSFAYQTVDRWQIGHTAGDKLTQNSSISSSVPPTGKSKRSLLFQTTHSGAAGDLQARQYIEDINIFDLIAKKVSLGAWVNSDSADTVRLIVSEPVSLNTFAGAVEIINQSFTIPNDGSWNFVEIENLLLPANTVNGLIVTVVFENFLNTAGTRNHLVAEAMLNEGKIVAPWKLFNPSDGVELAECQRYFEKTYNLDIAPGTVTGDGQWLVLFFFSQ